MLEDRKNFGEGDRNKKLYDSIPNFKKISSAV